MPGISYLKKRDSAVDQVVGLINILAE